MIGLIRKDLYLLSTVYKKNLISLFILYTALAVFLKMAVFGYIFSWVLGMYIVGIVCMDNYSKWDLYACCLPLTPMQIVSSKFLIILPSLTVGTLYSVVLCLVLKLIQPHYSLLENIVSSITCLLLALPYFGFTLAFSYKIGPEKARSSVMTGMIAVIGLGVLLSSTNQFDTLFSRFIAFINVHPVLFFSVVAFTCVILYLLSWFLALKWYQRKEF